MPIAEERSFCNNHAPPWRRLYRLHDAAKEGHSDMAALDYSASGTEGSNVETELSSIRPEKEKDARWRATMEHQPPATTYLTRTRLFLASCLHLFPPSLSLWESFPLYRIWNLVGSKETRSKLFHAPRCSWPRNFARLSRLRNGITVAAASEQSISRN